MGCYCEIKLLFGGVVIVERERLYKCNIVKKLFSGEMLFQSFTTKQLKEKVRKGRSKTNHKCLCFRGITQDLWLHIRLVRGPLCQVCPHPTLSASPAVLGQVSSPGISETLKKVSVSTTFAQSRLVSISTTPNFLVSKSLSLDNLQILGLR